MKEKWIEMQEEQSQNVNDEVKRAMNLTFQRLKTRFQDEQQYKGDEILSRSLDVIKKVTINVLSNTEEEEEEEEEIPKGDDQPTNGDKIDQQTLTEVMTSTENNQPKINNGWDTVDDLPKEDPPSAAVETPVTEEQKEEEETAPPVPDEQDSDTVESTSQVELPKDPSSDEDGKSSTRLHSIPTVFLVYRERRVIPISASIRSRSRSDSTSSKSLSYPTARRLRTSLVLVHIQ